MSRFIESIRVEGREPWLLPYHQKRVDETFAHFGAKGTLNLADIFDRLDHDEDGLYKLRVVYDLGNNHTAQLIPYAYSAIDSFRLVENNTVDYSFKTEDRGVFEQMKAKAKAAEIIIVKNGCITDTSYSNLIFLKDQTWYTPETCLLNGVQRQYLLETKKIEEAEITLQNLREFSHFQLINALNGFQDSFVYPLEAIGNLPQNSENEVF